MPHPDTVTVTETTSDREVIYLSMPATLLARVDVHLARLRNEAPAGCNVTRAAAIRNLLELALAIGVDS